ncbi:MAG: lipopolysaccharide biosynthesis protein [Terracidiphilus sp.]|jgi:O-antigen/teichoic acid export membrane protein
MIKLPVIADPRPLEAGQLERPHVEMEWAMDPEAAVALGSPDAAREPLVEVNRQFGRNVMATIVARIVNMARGVCLVPFLLAHIGLEAYGIWTTIFILVTYVGLTTMGISNVYIKYVAEFHAKREYDKANALLSTGLAVTIPLCAAIFAGLLLAWNWYSPWLHLPASHASDGKEAVLIVLGVFLSSIAFNAFGDMLTGTQQIASTQVFLTISILAEFALIVWLVNDGRGIRGLAEAYLARTVINDGLTWWWAHRTIKWLHLSPRKVQRACLKYVVHFGGLVQLQSILGIFQVSVDRLAALTLIDASAAGLLDVAKKWPTSVSSIPTAFFAALLPAASHVDAASERSTWLHNLQELYLRAARHSNLCTAAFSSVMALWALPILHVWLGPALPMRESLIPLFVLFSISMQFHMLTGPGTSIFRGMGRVYEEFNYSIPNILMLAVTLPLSRWMLGRWTPFGIGVAVSVATAGSACVLMGRVLFVLDMKLTRFLRVVVVPGFSCYAVAGLLAWPVARLVADVNRWQGAGVLFAAGLLYAAILVAVLYRWVLTDEEKQKGYGFLHRGLEVFRGQEATA